MIVFLILLSVVMVAPFSVATSQYSINIDISAGDEMVESFSLDSGSTFGWEVWVFSMSGVEVSLLDSENYQKRAGGQSFTCINGPTLIGAQGFNGSFYTTEQADTFYLVVKAIGPGTAEISIILTDVPFFSTSFGKIILMVIQGIGVVILIVFILIATFLLKAKIKKKSHDNNSLSTSNRNQSDYRLGETTLVRDKNKNDQYSKSSYDDYKAIDPFLDEPYKRNKPFWKKK